MILQIYIDADTERYLRAAAKDHGASLEWLAEAAVSEEALRYAVQHQITDDDLKRKERAR